MLTKDQVEDLRNKVYENRESAYPAMSYEQGIADALDVVMGYADLEEFEAELPAFQEDEDY